MRFNIFKAPGFLLLAGLLMPAGMLLATEIHQKPAVTSSTANWYDVEQASNMLDHIQNLALKVRKEVARLQVQEIELGWRAQSARLTIAKHDINTIGNDLVRLDQMRNRLEPWQQNLLNKITPALHEMVYQADAAIKKVNNHENRTYLALTQYPQNINQIYKNANQMANTIQTVTQYAQAEQKMAELNKGNRTTAGS